MKRPLVILITLTTLWLAMSRCQESWGQGIKGFFHSISIDAARNGCWPDAFVPVDRTNARLPFVLMVQNGWERQNLIGDHYFQEDGKTLTDSGKRQIKWILTQAPLHHRTIFVKEGDDADVTAARLQAVSETAIKLVGPDQKVDIRITNIDPPGWPAEYVDSVERAYLKTMPDPRLPARSAGADNQNSIGN
ncbi:MAG: hypothetical protein ACUVQR_07365 [Thermogutta sp.]